MNDFFIPLLSVIGLFLFCMAASFAICKAKTFEQNNCEEQQKKPEIYFFTNAPKAKQKRKKKQANLNIALKDVIYRPNMLHKIYFDKTE